MNEILIATGNSREEDQRREVRKEYLGDTLWSYASAQDKNSFEGAIIDESESGLSILTLQPIKAGSPLRIHCKGREDIRYATVIWCREVAADIYQSGLLMAE
jgi:hypothetical protein